MCIAILNTPKGGLIKRETLHNCWCNNTDGAGMVYHTPDNKLVVVKELKNFNKFFTKYEAARTEYPQSFIVLHFRIKTHGKCDKNNCHPFLVNNDLAFVHNGIISDVPAAKDKSDTWQFNKLILQPLAESDKNFIKNVAVRKLIRKYIGTGNKLIFLGSDGFAHITNEEAGNWFEDNWYSNYTYKYVSNYIDAGGITVKRTGKGAVRVTGFQAANTYVPATKLNQLEANFGKAPQPTKDSKEFNWKRDWRYDLPHNGSDCGECGTALTDRMEQYYGFCTSCLSKYGVEYE